ncbi:MAG: hypothetical protein CVV00_09175 [Firmicutes bacterium HGW-Firmicutes-5]|nr:MAG: hypothetical protein CVV00_09175 [Firmicutes bacterium HGW-Firmicutes-5]
MGLGKWKENILNTFDHGGILSIKSITMKNLPFFIVWILVLLWLDIFTMQYAAFQIKTVMYGVSLGDLYAYTYAMVAAILIFFLDGANYIRYTVYGALVAFLGFLASVVFPDSNIIFFLFILSALGMGLLAASAYYSFIMVLNNTEKFYSMVVIFCIARLTLLIKPYTDIGMLNMIMTKVMPTILLFAILVCTVFFKKNQTLSSKQSEKPIKPKIPIGAYSVLFIVVAVFVLNEGVVPAMLKTIKGIAVQDIDRLYTAGAITGVIILLIFQPILKRSIWHMWNLSFSILALGFMINIFTYWYVDLFRYSAVLYGCAYATGYINIYYMTGIMAKKYQSLKFLRIGVLTAGVSGILSHYVSFVVLSADSAVVSGISAFISIVVILVLFMLSPLFVKELYNAEWMDDMYRLDVTCGDRLTAKLKEYGVSPRELEVCIMLLEGYTMRQTAATLSLAYPTVNTYCVSLYKKLNINSRTELIVQLGEYAKHRKTL